MRPEDLARLNEPYPEHVEPTEADARSAIGVNLPHWTALADEIFADFTEQPPYGSGWWAPDPGASRRILISDQLHCCVESVAGNVTEAALHWLEYLGASDRDSARLTDAVKMTPTGPVISPPRPRNPFEQLCPDFIRIHQGGIIRALASALDCLAGVMIGTAALPMSILRADFDKARAKLAKINGAANAGASMQAQLAARLEAAIAAAGPQGWLDWTLDFRNMLVHRGRRIEIGQFLPIKPVLFGPGWTARAARPPRRAASPRPRSIGCRSISRNALGHGSARRRTTDIARTHDQHRSVAGDHGDAPDRFMAMAPGSPCRSSPAGRTMEGRTRNPLDGL